MKSLRHVSLRCVTAGILLVAITCSVSAQSLAQDATPRLSTPPVDAPEDDGELDDLQDEETANRQGKHAVVMIEPIGLTPWPGIGGSLGVFLRPDLLLEVSAAYGQAAFAIRNTDTLHVFAHTKFFMSDTEYLNFGVAMRKTVEREKSLYPQNSWSETKTLTSAGLGVSLGSRWHWQSFTLGCDWAGAYYPLAVVSRSYKDQNLSEAEHERRKKAFQDEKGAPSLQLLRLSLGFAF